MTVSPEVPNLNEKGIRRARELTYDEMEKDQHQSYRDRDQILEAFVVQHQLMRKS